jgi:hypothetical protein
MYLSLSNVFFLNQLFSHTLNYIFAHGLLPEENPFLWQAHRLILSILLKYTFYSNPDQEIQGMMGEMAMNWRYVAFCMSSNVLVLFVISLWTQWSTGRLCFILATTAA